MQHLVVVRPFGPWAVGEVVSEESKVEEILQSEFRDHVVRVMPVKEG